MSRFAWICGMVGSVAGALVGSGLPEPWNHRVMLIGTICAAGTGYQVPPRPRPWNGIDRRDNTR